MGRGVESYCHSTSGSTDNNLRFKMDIMPLVLSSIFLLVLFIGIIFIVVYIGYNTKRSYEDQNKKINRLSEDFRLLNEAYLKDMKDIIENQIEIIKKLKK